MSCGRSEQTAEQLTKSKYQFGEQEYCFRVLLSCLLAPRLITKVRKLMISNHFDGKASSSTKQRPAHNASNSSCGKSMILLGSKQPATSRRLQPLATTACVSNTNACIKEPQRTVASRERQIMKLKPPRGSCTFHPLPTSKTVFSNIGQCAGRGHDQARAG